MYNNENLKTVKPLIFAKKINDNWKILPLNKTINTLGITRYFPPANQEWFNSVYAYNNNYTKNITIADKSLSKLIKAYFNIYFSDKILTSQHIITRFRRSSINKVFISKSEIKHTSSKVIITLYVYNEERRILVDKIKVLETLLFSSTKLSSHEINKQAILSLKEKLNIIITQKSNISFKDLLETLKLSIIEEINLESNLFIKMKNLNIKKEKESYINTLEINLKHINYISSLCKKYPFSHKHYENLYIESTNNTFLEREIMTIAYLKLLLNLNKSKFEDKFLLALKPIITRIYNKDVEFNIVNLKTLYFNSDIFTQAISLKLRNRDNGLLRVLSTFLYLVKLPKVNIIKERFGYIDIKGLWSNKVKNLKVNSICCNKDSLHNLLLGLFPNSNFLKKLNEYMPYYSNNVINNNNMLNNVFNLLNYKSMAGVRLEAKGRLTRRFTASRSVFKIKWKGSLKNIDSSYKGLSSVMLRGYVKPNVQYSIVNTKTRNGAFGIKGWISGK